MDKYTVLVRETHIAHIEVEATDEQDAIEAVREGNGELITTEYSDTLSPDTWTVEGPS